MSTRRRQRAAYELALCILRRGAHMDGGRLISPAYKEGHAQSACEDAADAIRLGHSRFAFDSLRVPLCEPRAYRIFRSRLALYLRAWLRADAGDCGPAIEWVDGGWSVVASRRIKPLWERAGGGR